MAKTRKPYFDLMRIVAIFFVIWNHTGKMGFGLFSQQTPGSGKYWIYLLPSIFCTFAVPLFFMISGALVLPKATARDVWTKRIPKMTLILVGFSLIYHVLAAMQGDITKYATLNNGLQAAMDGLPGGSTISDAETLLNLPSAGLFITVLYSGTWNFSFWFLYAYIAFLISAPLLRTLAEHLSNRQYLYLFGVYLVFKAGVPILNWTVFQGAYTLNNSASLTWLTADIVIYPLAGYFLEHRFPVRTLKGNRWFLPALWGTVLLCTVLAGAMTWRKSLLTGQYNEGACQTFHRIFNLLTASAMYLSIKTCFFDREGFLKEGKTWSRALLKSAGTCTFGIYLWHVAVLKSDFLTLRFPVLCEEIDLPHLFVGVLQVLITMAICWAVTALWKGGESLVRKNRKE